MAIFALIEQEFDQSDDVGGPPIAFATMSPFYAGHFPGRPITPDVIPLECVAHCGMVRHGLYLLALDGNENHWRSHQTLLTDGLRIRSRVEIYKAGGERLMAGVQFITSGSAAN